jgi:hypothetical protein
MVVLQTSLTYRHPEFSQPFHFLRKGPMMNRVLAHAGARYPVVHAPMAQHLIEETVAQFFAIAGRLGGLTTEHQFGWCMMTLI